MARAVVEQIGLRPLTTFASLYDLTLQDELLDLLSLFLLPLDSRIKSMPDHVTGIAIVETHGLGVTHQYTCARIEVALLVQIRTETLDELLLHSDFLGPLLLKLTLRY